MTVYARWDKNISMAYLDWERPTTEMKYNKGTVYFENTIPPEPPTPVESDWDFSGFNYTIEQLESLWFTFSWHPWPVCMWEDWIHAREEWYTEYFRSADLAFNKKLMDTIWWNILEIKRDTEVRFRSDWNISLYIWWQETFDYSTTWLSVAIDRYVWTEATVRDNYEAKAHFQDYSVYNWLEKWSIKIDFNTGRFEVKNSEWVTVFDYADKDALSIIYNNLLNWVYVSFWIEDDDWRIHQTYPLCIWEFWYESYSDPEWKCNVVFRNPDNRVLYAEELNKWDTPDYEWQNPPVYDEDIFTWRDPNISQITESTLYTAQYDMDE